MKNAGHICDKRIYKIYQLRLPGVVIHLEYTPQPLYNTVVGVHSINYVS